MKPTTFTTKAEYLQWRTEWRARYKQISQEIRELSLAVRAIQSGPGRDKWAPQREKIMTTIKRVCADQTGMTALWSVLCVLAKLRVEAHSMLELRKESKLRAQEEYLKAHQSSSVPS